MKMSGKKVATLESPLLVNIQKKKREITAQTTKKKKKKRLNY